MGVFIESILRLNQPAISGTIVGKNALLRAEIPLNSAIIWTAQYALMTEWAVTMEPQLISAASAAQCQHQCPMQFRNRPVACTVRLLDTGDR